jgi:hypothetical protein
VDALPAPVRSRADRRRGRGAVVPRRDADPRARRAGRDARARARSGASPLRRLRAFAQGVRRDRRTARPGDGAYGIHDRDETGRRLRAADAAANARVHRRRRADARAGHRREHRDLQRRVRRAPPAAAVSRRRAPPPRAHAVPRRDVVHRAVRSGFRERAGGDARLRSRRGVYDRDVHAARCGRAARGSRRQGQRRPLHAARLHDDGGAHVPARRAPAESRRRRGARLWVLAAHVRRRSRRDWAFRHHRRQSLHDRRRAREGRRAHGRGGRVRADRIRPAVQRRGGAGPAVRVSRRARPRAAWRHRSADRRGSRPDRHAPAGRVSAVQRRAHLQRDPAAAADRRGRARAPPRADGCGRIRPARRVRERRESAPGAWVGAAGRARRPRGARRRPKRSSSG